MKKSSTCRILACVIVLCLILTSLCGCSLESLFSKNTETAYLEGTVYCYAEPDIHSEIVKEFANGLQISYNPDALVGDLRWIETEFGWIHLEPVENAVVEGNNTMEQVAFITAPTVNVHAGPGATYELLTQITAGTMVCFTDMQEAAGIQWGRIEEGWIQVDNVYIPGTKGLNTGYAVVRESGASVYDRIFEYGSAVDQLATGARFEVLEIISVSSGEWAYVEGGWVNVSNLYIEGRKGNRPCSGMVIDSTPLNVRVGPGTDYSINTSLPYGTYVNVLERINCNGNDWGYTGSGWIFMNLVDIS